MKEFPFRKVTGIGRNSATRKIGKNQIPILQIKILFKLNNCFSGVRNGEENSQ
jgi:hypothetical protein